MQDLRVFKWAGEPSADLRGMLQEHEALGTPIARSKGPKFGSASISLLLLCVLVFTTTAVRARQKGPKTGATKGLRTDR